MKRLIIFSTSVLLFLLFSIPAKVSAQTGADTTSTMGRKFIVAVPEISTGTKIRMIKVAAGNATTKVRFTFNNITGNGRVDSVVIQPGQVYSKPVSGAEELSLVALKAGNITGTAPNQILASVNGTGTILGTTAAISNRTVIIEADYDVSVYVLNSANNNGDATIVLPVPTWGSDYYHISRTPSKGNDGFGIVAAENGTTVTISRSSVSPFNGGVYASFTLNANQSMSGIFPAGIDASGWEILATKPIGYFVFTEEINLGGSSSAYFEQIMANTKWGAVFLVPMVNSGDRVKIVNAKLAPTQIDYYYNSTTPTTITLQAGAFMELTATANNSSYYIKSQNAIEVALQRSTVITSSPFANSTVPRPSMSNVPSLYQAIESITIAPFNVPSDMNNGHYAIVVAPWGTRDSTKVTFGTTTQRLTNTLYSPALPNQVGTWIRCVGNPNFGYYVMPLQNTSVSYTFAHSQGVLVWIYGCGSNNSYCYVGGSATRDLSSLFYLENLGTLDGRPNCISKEVVFEADLKVPMSTNPDFLIWELGYFCQSDTLVWLKSVDTAVNGNKYKYGDTIFGVKNCLFYNIVERDIYTFMIPMLPNGIYALRVTATDGFDNKHTVEGGFIQACPEPEAYDDYATIPACLLSKTEINVLANDTVCGCTHNPQSSKMPSCLVPSINVQAVNGIATPLPNGNIKYVPNNPNFLGIDSFQYKIVCGDLSSADSATVYLLITECPDNIINADCYGDPIPQDWSIKELKSNLSIYSPYQCALVGDMDGDGISEIVVAMNPLPNGSVVGVLPSPMTRPCSQLAIFKGNNITTPWKTINLTVPFSWDHITKYGIVKTQIGGKDTVLIVVATADRLLKAYNYNGGLVWTSSAVYHSINSTVGYNSTAPAFADFNNDGIPEIMVKGKIFDSRNGQLLCGMSTDPPFQACVPIAADLFNTGKPNFIVGNNIYTVNSSPSWSLTLVRTYNIPINPLDTEIPTSGLPLPRPAFMGIGQNNDAGLVSAVDINNDGKLELIYQLHRSGLASPYLGEALIAVIDPATGNVMASKYISSAVGGSYPLVGDIDGCGKPEIVFITTRANLQRPAPAEEPYWLMHALKYVDGNPFLQRFWTIQHQDPSGNTGMTLFDFNQDGIQEIVYRDEENLRIINGSLKHHLTGLPSAPYDLSPPMPNASGTSAEYPVIADVDGDGQAEIVIVGGDAIPGTSVILGSLRVYKSGSNTSTWAPTRSVWNQHAYNIVNVNEDLTIPKFPLSPATVFPGKDGILGTSDDVRPYNGFMMQQTTLNGNGNPLWRLPHIVIYDTNTTRDYTNDSITIIGKIKNTGDAPMSVPIYITIYKNETGDNNNIIKFDSILKVIMPGEVVNFSYTIGKLLVIGAGSGVGSIWISINDSLTKYPYYSECYPMEGRSQFIMEGYTVTYDLNGAPGAKTYDIPSLGTLYTIKPKPPGPGILPDSIYFDGWNTEPDGSGTRYRPGDTLTLKENLYLYAMWNEAYGVYDWADLADVNNKLTENFILMNSLDKFSGFYETYIGGYGNDPTGGKTSMGNDPLTGWRPLGTTIAPYVGTFNGNNLTIADLWLDRTVSTTSGIYAYGLFGVVAPGGKIYNLNIELGKNDPTDPNAAIKVGINVKGTTGNIVRVGGLAGSSNGDIIGNISVLRGEVNGGNSTSTGGIVGYANDDYIAGAFVNNATVTSRGSAGGIFGRITNDTKFNNTYLENNGEVRGTGTGLAGDRIGGIASSYEVTTTAFTHYVFSGLPNGDVQIKNTGNVSGQSNDVGGVFGYVTGIAAVTIQDYENSVNVTGVQNVGGIVGHNANDTIFIDRCYNTGRITATTYAGGIVGHAQDSARFSNVYNLGPISGSQSGGIVGRWESRDSILYAYNAGKLSGTQVYGIVGFVGANGLKSIYLNYDTVTSGVQVGAPGAFNAQTTGKSTCEMIYELDATATGYSAARGWGYGWDNKRTYPYLTWQTTVGKDNEIGFDNIDVEHDHPAPDNNPAIEVAIPMHNAAIKTFNVYAPTYNEYYMELYPGYNTVNTIITKGKIMSVGVMSESDIVTFDPWALCHVFPIVDTIAGEHILCVGETLTLTDATPGGFWSLSNDNVIESSQSSSPASITVVGDKEGKVYISYTFGYCKCKTTQTFLLKVIGKEPEIKTGFEK